MSFDSAIEFEKARQAFVKSRGGTIPLFLKKPGTVHAFFKGTELVPATTWGDVLVFSEAFIKATDPNCSLSTSKDMQALAECAKVKDFVHTGAFNEARRDWESWFPTRRESNPATLANLVMGKQMYPYNEQFWGYGKLYSFERGAAGMVPTKWSMATDSLKEAVQELPANLKKAADAVIPSIPNPTKWTELIKWVSIAGGLGMLYWYVLRPKKSS